MASPRQSNDKGRLHAGPDPSTQYRKGQTNEDDRETGKLGHGAIQQLPYWEVWPSPENDELYGPIVESDPELVSLADSIREHGVKEPLVLTADCYILSGHRRYAAANLAGLNMPPVRIEQAIRRSDCSKDEYLQHLRDSHPASAPNCATD